MSCWCNGLRDTCWGCTMYQVEKYIHQKGEQLFCVNLLLTNMQILYSYSQCKWKTPWQAYDIKKIAEGSRDSNAKKYSRVVFTHIEPWVKHGYTILGSYHWHHIIIILDHDSLMFQTKPFPSPTDVIMSLANYCLVSQTKPVSCKKIPIWWEIKWLNLPYSCPLYDTMSYSCCLHK